MIVTAQPLHLHRGFLFSRFTLFPSCCQTSLEKEPVVSPKKRQVFDLPAVGIEGTITNIHRSFGKRLSLFEQQVREQILQSPVIHFDETSIRTNGKLQWLHTMSTKDVTLQYVHPKRGKEAMDEIGTLLDSL